MSIEFDTRVTVDPGISNFQIITHGFWEAHILPPDDDSRDSSVMNRSALWLLAWAHSHLPRHARMLSLTDIGERVKMDRKTVRRLFQTLSDDTPFVTMEPRPNGLPADIKLHGQVWIDFIEASANRETARWYYTTYAQPGQSDPVHDDPAHSAPVPGPSRPGRRGMKGQHEEEQESPGEVRTSSLGATTSADAESLLTQASGLTVVPPTGPPEHMFPNGMCFGTTMPKRWWTIATDNQKTTVLSEMPEWAPYLPTAAPTPVKRGDAPSVVEDPARLNVIRRPEGLARALSRGYGFEVSSQADRRNIAKLLDLKPTIGQLDGAIEAMGWIIGQPLDLGRLVTKWATFSTARSTRPKAWKTERTNAKDAVAAHEAAGGNKYDLDGTVDYGV